MEQGQLKILCWGLSHKKKIVRMFCALCVYSSFLIFFLIRIYIAKRIYTYHQEYHAIFARYYTKQHKLWMNFFFFLVCLNMKIGKSAIPSGYILHTKGKKEWKISISYNLHWSFFFILFIFFFILVLHPLLLYRYNFIPTAPLFVYRS